MHVRTDISGQKHITETVWNDGPGSGTGGGVSDYTPVPGWQQGIVPKSINPGNFEGRAIPDVAADADPNTGYRVMSGGEMQIVGGTSASAPLWASLIARINAIKGAPVWQLQSLLYSTLGPAGVLARYYILATTTTDGLLNGHFPRGPRLGRMHRLGRAGRCGAVYVEACLRLRYVLTAETRHSFSQLASV